MMNPLFTNYNFLAGQVYDLGLPFLPGKSRRLLYNPIKLFLHDHSYDVVHVHSGSISVLAYVAKAARRSGVQKVIVHSHASGVTSLKHNIIRFVFGFMLRRNATDFLACSKEAGVMKYPLKVVKRKLVVIKNEIDINEYRFDASKREQVRKELGITEEAFVFGHVGRFSIEKNHEFLIEVFLQVHEKIPNSKLLLVGDGELRSEIESKVKKLNLEDAVRFVGNVDNVQDYYQTMDAFLLPSIYEGLSFVTIEAQAAGLPCVVSTGVPETVKIADNVFRVDLADKQSWIDKAIALKNMRSLDNSELIRRAGYDIKDTAAQIRKLYVGNESVKNGTDRHASIAEQNSGSGIKRQTEVVQGDMQEESKLRVLEITGEPILHGGQEKFIQNLIENIDHTNLTIDVLTPYYCENEAFVRSVQNGGGTAMS